jgi:protein-L-isoaspartate(D-aspartate) O-methyltransferase
MDERMEEAFRVFPRWEFLPDDVANMAAWDVPLPIGYGQTNSQPQTVELMLGWLDVQERQKILDLGSGSGWTSALLAHMTGPHGKVVAVEVVPDLVEFGSDNCERLGIKNVGFHRAGPRLGRREEAPYDRILVSASARRLPEELIDQLAENGKMVIPVMQSVLVVEKTRPGNLSITEHPGFLFVPLI